MSTRFWLLFALVALLPTSASAHLPLLIPDVVPVLGSVDDLLVLAFAVDYLLKGVPLRALMELPRS